MTKYWTYATDNFVLNFYNSFAQDINIYINLNLLQGVIQIYFKWYLSTTTTTYHMKFELVHIYTFLLRSYWSVNDIWTANNFSIFFINLEFSHQFEPIFFKYFWHTCPKIIAVAIYLYNGIYNNLLYWT